MVWLRSLTCVKQLIAHYNHDDGGLYIINENKWSKSLYDDYYPLLKEEFDITLILHKTVHASSLLIIYNSINYFTY